MEDAICFKIEDAKLAEGILIEKTLNSYFYIFFDCSYFSGHCVPNSRNLHPLHQVAK